MTRKESISAEIDKNQPLLQRIGNLDIKTLCVAIEQMISDHTVSSDRVISQILKSDRSLSKSYDNSLHVEEINYTKSFYDSISVKINALGVLMTLKLEHSNCQIIAKLDLDRFYEMYLKSTAPLKVSIESIPTDGLTEITHYKVTLSKESDLKEFIQQVLCRNYEWGSIAVAGSNHTLNFKYGNIESNGFSEKELSSKIYKVVAVGGWSSMYYTVYLKYE